MVAFPTVWQHLNGEATFLQQALLTWVLFLLSRGKRKTNKQTNLPSSQTQSNVLLRPVLSQIFDG